MTGGQELLLARAAAAPDRPDGVQDVTGGQVTSAGRLHVAGVAPAELAALVENRRPTRAVDRAVDAATAEQRRVGRVHDGVDVLLGDVAEDEFDHAYAGRGKRTGRSAGNGIRRCLNAVAR